jgi:hypothetical protein
MTPQIIDAVPKTPVDGHQKPSFWSRSHMPSMLVNIQAWTPSWTVPAMICARLSVHS